MYYYGQQPQGPTPSDYSNVRTLGICTLVYSGIAALASLFGLIYVFIGIAIAAEPPTPSNPDPEIMGGFFVLIGAIVSFIFFAKCILLIFSGVGLLGHKWRTVTYIAAGISCANVPLGTLLGVFTFIVLAKPGVKAIYDATQR